MPRDLLRLYHFQSTIGAEGEGGGGEEIPAEQRPEWLLEKFQSPDEQARAYAEAEREMQRLRSEREKDRHDFQDALARLTEESEQRQQQQAQVPYNPQADPILAAYETALMNGDAQAALAIQMTLARQLAQEEVASQVGQLAPQLTTLQAQNREYAIEAAERAVREEALAAGLDYDASRDEIAQAIVSLGGLPEQGDQAAYATMIRNGVKIVHAEAALQAVQAQESNRREKLSAMTTPAGVPGRIAQGTSAEKDAWAEVKGAQTGSYQEMMGRNSR